MVGGSQCEETVWQVWLSGLGLASARHAHTYLGAQQVFSTSVKLGVLQVNSSLDVKSTQPALESECRRAPCLVATVFEKKTLHSGNTCCWPIIRSSNEVYMGHWHK